MNSIGGYFELELRKGNEYHPNAIALNTGRNALELILKIKKYKKVYIPFYSCDVILEPIKKLNIEFEFYPIDKNFEPMFNYQTLKKHESFLYINYFGIKDAFIYTLANLCNNLIIDNSQAFYAKPIINIPTFYSCRKFFGVPDGAYLYLDGVSAFDFPKDHSESRFAHLLKRIEYGAELGFIDFKANENRLIGQHIMQMSKITKSLLCSIDYEFAREKRSNNFLFLHRKLSRYNKLEININKESAPMIYPFFTIDTALKQKLITNNIFIASYWTNVLEWTNKESIENKFTSQIIPLPIDQRYGMEELKKIVKRII
jgi:hypothetical protein